MTPELSVLLPARNAGRFLESAVGDVLRQEGLALELVAVDDGSTDGTGERLERMAAADPRLRVIRTGGVGPARALKTALAAARAPLIGQMEADDRCPSDRFARLAALLLDHPDWDAAVSRAGLLGLRTEGMRRYLGWQNRLLEPDALARARFIEIPAMHQTGLYRRPALERLGFLGDPRWPLDIDLWMRWFEQGLVVGKVPRVLYHWRQHARQATRTSALHQLESLRTCKAHYFVRGPGRGRTIELFSVGTTLVAWSAALCAAGAREVRAQEWRPGAAPPAALRAPPSRDDPVRLFVYGMEPARMRARAALAGFEHEHDWFAA